MTSLAPNASVQEVEDELLFQQTLLDTLEDNESSDERRDEIEAAIQDLEQRMARANNEAEAASQTDSHSSYNAPGAFPSDDDALFPQLDGPASLKRNRDQLSPTHSSPSKRPAPYTLGPASQTSYSNGDKRKSAFLERQRQYEDQVRIKKEAEAADAAYASRLSQQPASPAIAGPSRTNSYSRNTMPPSKMAPVFRPQGYHPSTPSHPQPLYPTPAASHVKAEPQYPRPIKSEGSQSAPQLRRTRDPLVIDLTGDDDDAPNPYPMPAHHQNVNVQDMRARAAEQNRRHEEELRRQGLWDQANRQQQLQRRQHQEFQRQQEMVRLQQYQQQMALMNRPDMLHQTPQYHVNPYPAPPMHPSQFPHTYHHPTQAPSYPNFHDLTQMNGLLNSRGRKPSFDVLDDVPDDDSDDGLQFIRSQARHFDSPQWDIMDSEATKEELRKLMENIQPDDLDKVANEDDVTIEALTIKLKPYQNTGLEWLQKMEDGTNKGGILADDMGLGKTVQAISLMVTRRSEDPVCKTTLILAPVALLRQWEQEIMTKVRPGRHRLHVFVHHASSKKKSHKDLRNFDVVLTTFGTIAAELKKIERYELRKKADPEARPREDEKCLFIGDDCKWYRIIVDEAQCIKNRTTKTARAAFYIHARSRFCMTGTPMMNSVEELYSLIHFLRIKPYNNWNKFRSDFVQPLRATNERGREAAMHKLQVLLKAVLLRRNKQTKINGRPILNLPERRVEESNPEFSKDEREIYNAIETKSAVTFNKYLKAGTVNKSYAQILVLLLRLRQACCHPHLIKDLGVVAATAEITQEAMDEICRNLDPGVVKRIKEADGVFECPVCYDAVENPAIFTPCGHDTCADCFTRIADPSNAVAEGEEGARMAKCPECRGPINTKKVLDYECFKRIHLPDEGSMDGPGSLGMELNQDGEAVDDDSDTDSDEEDVDDDETSSLDGFIVNGEAADDNDDEDAAERKQKAALKPKKEGKSKMSKKAKGKRKSKGDPEKKRKIANMSVPELKKLAVRSRYWRKMYLRTIKKGYIPSAKIDQTMELLDPIIANPEGEKIIIFSQWTSLLDLLEVPISDKGWGYRRYDGSMNAKLRADAVDDFKNRPQVRMMLVSLKAGNAGLNLNCASQVIILDPFWNPYIEEQAIDRAHRLGQTRPVMVHRILIQDTVEDRIIALQEKKRALISEALDEKASQGIGRLSVQELAYLFGINRGMNDPVHPRVAGT